MCSDRPGEEVFRSEEVPLFWGVFKLWILVDVVQEIPDFWGSGFVGWGEVLVGEGFRFCFDDIGFVQKGGVGWAGIRFLDFWKRVW